MQNKKRPLVALAITLVVASPVSAQLINKTVDVDGVTREYLMYLPASYDGSLQLPLMFSFHGGGGTSLSQLLLSDMRPIADAQGVVLVYPQGLPEFGDSGPPIWNSVGPFSNGVDEIGFAAAMIDALAAEFAIDQSRVYASGYSNGANLVWELACFLSDRITAVGAVAGSMWEWTENLCAPTRPVPVLSIHGTLDFYNPYNGGPPFSLGLIAASEYWVQNARADAMPSVVDLPDTVPGDGSTVDHYTWANGDQCVSIEHYKVAGGGHDWPGEFGNMDIDSTQVIWAFVSQFDLAGEIGCPDDPQDSDGDGLADSLDNCTLVANADQRDTDGDGFGNECDPDLNDDCSVNFVDLGEFKAAFTPNPYDPDADFNGDGFVNFVDLGRLKALFVSGPTPGPGPSGVPNVCARQHLSTYAR